MAGTLEFGVRDAATILGVSSVVSLRGLSVLVTRIRPPMYPNQHPALGRCIGLDLGSGTRLGSAPGPRSLLVRPDRTANHRPAVRIGKLYELSKERWARWALRSPACRRSSNSSNSTKCFETTLASRRALHWSSLAFAEASGSGKRGSAFVYLEAVATRIGTDEIARKVLTVPELRWGDPWEGSTARRPTSLWASAVSLKY